jgi:hypothetical protein
MKGSLHKLKLEVKLKLKLLFSDLKLPTPLMQPLTFLDWTTRCKVRSHGSLIVIVADHYVHPRSQLQTSLL